MASPAEFEVFNGRGVVKLVWSSQYYDYMIVNGKKYFPVNKEGENSTFVVPVIAYDEPVPVIGDTTAMSEAHEVEYTLTVKRDTIAEYEIVPDPPENAERANEIDWPWIIFAICAFLSLGCIGATVYLLRAYRLG